MPRSSLTLRTRLTLGFIAVFLVIQSALVGGVVLVRRSDIRGRFDEGLLEVARAASAALLETPPPWSDQELASLLPVGARLEGMTVRAADGEVLAFEGRGLVVPLPDDRGGEAGVPAWRTIEGEAALDLGGSGDLRVVHFTQGDGAGNVYRIAAARATESIELALDSSLDLLVLGIPIGLLATGLTVWLLAGRSAVQLQRLAEAARRLSPSHLGERIDVGARDQEIVRLQAELNEALARLADGYRAQEQFIANVAHDLKTPIAVVLTEAQTRKGRGLDADSAEAFIESTEEEMLRLGELVESFLTLARTQQGEELTERVPVHVNDVVIDSIAHCTPDAEQYEVHLVPMLHLDESGGNEAVLHGDPTLLRTMLDNLLRNAIRFSPVGGEVLVRAGRSDDTITLEVRDHGPGIPEAYIEHVFDRFVRAPADSTRSRSTGLGLAIARSVVELHGGSIRAENVDEGGCRMQVRLPRDGIGRPLARP